MKTQSAAFYFLTLLPMIGGPRIDLTTSNMPAGPPAQTIASENAFPGLSFSQPLGIVSAPGEVDRIFIVEKTGEVRVVQLGTPPQATTFLNVRDVLSQQGEALLTNSEQGVLGLEFHPDYQTNGRFYVVYNVWSNNMNYQRLSEFTVSDNMDVADSTSEKVFIQQINDAGNHNGGDIHFGADGYLYMSWGDEGNANDTLDNSQQIDKDFWSSLTRIDVDLEVEDYTANDGQGNDDANLRPNSHQAVVLDSEGNPRYEVPVDNPWVGADSFLGKEVTAQDVRTEFYAVGLRNPWRFSFDRATNTLWLGDVGQGQREEINRVVKGGNYEWAFREGFVQGVKWGDRPSGWTGSHPPVIDYNRSFGRSVTGGVVYRGSRIPSLTGKYIFGDYATGSIWRLDESPNGNTMVRITGQTAVAGFGHDPSNGDILMANLNGGTIHRLVGQNIEDDFPGSLAETGLFENVVSLEPADGLLAYDVNLPFWSDGAEKQRWFGIPNQADMISFSEDGNWGLPSGMTWVKHFEIDAVVNGQLVKKRLETRVMVRTDEGNYGVSYQWNEQGTQATLVPSGGVDFEIQTIRNGQQVTQTWQIPSRSQCATCHTPEAGHALSFRTRQLNREGEITGDVGNFIQLMANSGYLEGLDESVNHLPRHYKPDDMSVDQERRVRSYLDVNCAYCHNSESAVPTDWDASADVKLFATKMINGEVQNGKLHPQDKLLTPGSAQRSVVYNRLAAENGYTRMPPSSTTIVDEAGAALLRNWIENLLINRESYASWRSANFGDSANAGLPGSDDDLDGRTNQSEFLSGTNPGVADAAPAVQITSQGGSISLSMQGLQGRDVYYEASDDLIAWDLIDVFGNNGTNRVATSISSKSKFFRARIEER